jgi:hypothetical protein
MDFLAQRPQHFESPPTPAPISLTGFLAQRPQHFESPPTLAFIPSALSCQAVSSRSHQPILTPHRRSISRRLARPPATASCSPLPMRPPDRTATAFGAASRSACRAARRRSASTPSSPPAPLSPARPALRPRAAGPSEPRPRRMVPCSAQRARGFQAGRLVCQSWQPGPFARAATAAIRGCSCGRRSWLRLQVDRQCDSRLGMTRR